jgi:hypothetical protein
MDQFVAIVNIYKEFVPETHHRAHVIDYILQKEKKGDNFVEMFDLELSVSVVQVRHIILYRIP